MANITERHAYVDIQQPNGNVERIFPITKYKDIEDIPVAVPGNGEAGPVKLYEDTGINEDGSLSQKAATEKLTKIQAALQLLAANSYIIDDTDGKTYKIGSDNGKLYLTESDVSPKEIADMIVIATENLVKSL